MHCLLVLVHVIGKLCSHSTLHFWLLLPLIIQIHLYDVTENKIYPLLSCFSRTELTSQMELQQSNLQSGCHLQRLSDAAKGIGVAILLLEYSHPL